MGYRLKHGLSYCTTGGRVIFLDLASNRYFCLSRRLEAAFQRLVISGAPDESDAPHVDILAKRGIVIATARDCTIAGCGLAGPALDVPDVVTAEVGTGLVVQCIAAQLSVIVRLRTTSIERIFASLEGRKRRAAQNGTSGSATVVASIEAAFRYTNLLFRPADRCLPRSLAFLSMCYSHGLFPTLVIGVAVNPFKAHAWVQAEGKVWHDDIGEAHRFTPILAV